MNKDFINKRNVTQDNDEGIAALKDSKINILLVDDRPDKLLALQAALESLGQNLITANSGSEALRALLNDDFAVILLDVSMPGMDGFQTASLIRQRIRSEHTPIIFVTSINTNENHVSQGYSLGAVDYVFSPVEPEILRAKVSVFIDLFKQSLQIKEQAELLRSSAEQRADYLESRLNSLLTRLNVGYFKADLSGKILQRNPAFNRLFELSDEVINNFSIKDLGPDLNNLILSPPQLGNKSIDIEWTCKDSSKIWLAISLSYGHRPDGTYYMEGIVEDISNRKKNEELLRTMNEVLEKRVEERSEALKQSQEHLRRSERLASLGTLAAGIAHEINNPLNSILMSSDYARKYPDNKQIIDQAFAVISENTKRCGRIIKGVLQFARNQKTAKDCLELNNLIRNATELMKTYVTKALEIRFELSEQDLYVYGNQTELEQVIVNILQNAADATENKVIITIHSAFGNDKAELTITDNGPGVPANIIDKIFDPFFSTRNGRGGTGLGLSVAHGIISEHNGTLRAHNSEKGGAEFIINLPVIKQDSNSKPVIMQEKENSL